MSTEEQPVSDAEPVAGDPLTLDPPTPEPSQTTKIVLVEGEQWSVPYDTPTDQVRENLAATFPGIRTATVRKGTTTIEGIVYETIEFTKQAGTKGQGGHPPHPLLPLLQLRRRSAGTVPNHAHARMVRRGLLSFEVALALPLFPPTPPRSPALMTGMRLCQRLETLSAVAAGPGLPVPGWSA